MHGAIGSARTSNLLVLVLLTIAVCLGFGAMGSNDERKPVRAGYSYPGSVPAPSPPPEEGSTGFFTAHWSGPGAFGSERGLADETGIGGRRGANGVPDFIDRWAGTGGHLQAVFVFDDLSGGRRIDRSALVDTDETGPASVPPGQDLVNAYAFTTRNAASDLLLYAATERLASAGPSELVFEFNQDRFRLSDTGTIDGERHAGDLRVRATFDSLLESVEFEVWSIGEADDTGRWTPLDLLVGRRCNSEATICALSNTSPVEPGPWPSYDSTGERVEMLAPGTLLEVAINLSRLADTELREVTFGSLQIRSMADFAVAGFTNRPVVR